MRTHPLTRAVSLTALAGACFAGLLAPAKAAPLPARSAAGGQLVFYSAQGYDATMAKAFQQESGIKVLLTDDSTGPTVARIEAERNNPHWDVAWFDGDATMQALDNQGLLLKWTPTNISNYTRLGRSLIPMDHAFFPTGITAAGVIVYNTRKLSSAQAPQEWTDLLKPAFKNQVAMNNPSISGPTYPMVAGLMQRLGGIPQGESFFKSLKTNGLHVYDTNTPTLHSLETGSVEAAIVQDTAYYEAKVNGEPVGVVYPRSGVTALATVIAINARAPDLAAAKQFVNYILSRAGQTIMIHDPNDSDSFYRPIITGVQALPGREVSGINWQVLNPIWGAAHENAIKSWFTDTIVQ